MGVLAEGESYSLSGVKVRSFKGPKYLSIPKIGFQCMPIADIGTVCTTTPDIDEVHSIDRVQVQGVKYFDTYRACYAKVNPTTDTIGKCTRCQSIQRLDKCSEQISAKIEVANKTDTKFSPAFHL